MSGAGRKNPFQPSTTNPEATKAAPGGKETPQPTTPKGINQTSKVKIRTVLWEFETGDSEYGVDSSSAISSDGTLYVGSTDNKLYAIKTESKGLAKSPWPMRGQNAQHTGRAK